jgi:hypothetical protein
VKKQSFPFSFLCSFLFGLAILFIPLCALFICLSCFIYFLFHPHLLVFLFHLPLLVFLSRLPLLVFLSRLPLLVFLSRLPLLVFLSRLPLFPCHPFLFSCFFYSFWFLFPIFSLSLSFLSSSFALFSSIWLNSTIHIYIHDVLSTIGLV